MFDRQAIQEIQPTLLTRPIRGRRDFMQCKEACLVPVVELCMVIQAFVHRAQFRIGICPGIQQHPHGRGIVLQSSCKERSNPLRVIVE